MPVEQKTMTEQELVMKLNQIDSDLAEEHRLWWPIWQDIYDYINRKNIVIGTDIQARTKRPRVKIYDETAVRAARVCTDNFQGYTVPQSAPWFALRVPKEFEKDQQAKNAFADAEEALYTAFQRSNWYQAANETINDAVTTGTAIMWVEEDISVIPSKIRFIPRNLNEIKISENQYGVVDTVCRKFKMTPARAKEFFGEDWPEDYQISAPSDSINSRIGITHIVCPTNSEMLTKAGQEELKRIMKGDGSDKFCSVYLIDGYEKIVCADGYNYMPYIVWRWSKRAGDTYGWGAGCTMIRTCIMLNLMKKTLLDAAQLAAKPPIIVSGSANTKLIIEPGAQNYMENPDGKVTPVFTGPNYQIATDILAQTKLDIEKGFYNDVFLMLEGVTRQITAQEAAIMQSEKMATLSSTVGRFGSEFLEPAIKIVSEILTNNGTLEANAITNEIEFVGPLTQAQTRYFKTFGIKNALQESMMMVELTEGSVLANIDMDKAYRQVLEDSGFPTDFFNDPKQVQAQRAAMQQQQQQVLNEVRQQKAQEASDKHYDALTKAPEPGSPAGAQLSQPSPLGSSPNPFMQGVA